MSIQTEQMNQRIVRGDFDFFLSYNTSDRAWVAAIKEYLFDRGILCWMDKDDLRKGRDWVLDIDSALEQAPGGILVIGTSGLGQIQKSEYSTLYIKAIEDNIPLIPVLLPGASPTNIPPLARSFIRITLDSKQELSPLDEVKKVFFDLCCEDKAKKCLPDLSKLHSILTGLDISAPLVDRFVMIAAEIDYLPDFKTGLMNRLAYLYNRFGVEALGKFVELCRLRNNGKTAELSWWLENTFEAPHLLRDIQCGAQGMLETQKTIERESKPRVQIVVVVEETSSRFSVSSTLRFGTEWKKFDNVFGQKIVNDWDSLKNHFKDIIIDACGRLLTQEKPFIQIFVPYKLLDESFEWFSTSPIFNHPDGRPFCDYWEVAVASSERYLYQQNISAPISQCRQIFQEISNSNKRILDLKYSLEEASDLKKKFDAEPHAVRATIHEFSLYCEQRQEECFAVLASSHIPVAIWTRKTDDLAHDDLERQLEDEILDWPERTYRLRKGLSPSGSDQTVDRNQWKNIVLFWDDGVEAISPSRVGPS